MAAIIIVISYISANRLERRGIVIGILGAGVSGSNILITEVGAGNSNNLAGDTIFRNLFLRFGFTANSRIVYIFGYILIFRGIRASGYRV